MSQTPPSEEVFTFSARGHPNITATHPTTIEITREPTLSVRGNCIIGVSASHVLTDIPDTLQFMMRQLDSRIALEIRVGSLYKVTVEGQGHPGLSFESINEIVCRTSDYIDERTLMTKANMAAAELPRSMISQLQDSNTRINFRLQVSSFTSPE
ncbi:MAG: DUF371 domain-containing protein [Candidatus Ranarchaeia archaeon]